MRTRIPSLVPVLAALAAACGPRAALPQRPPITDAEASRLEREVVAEMNLARTDPDRYALVLEAMLPRFDGKILRRTDGSLLQTDEGAPAVREAIAALRAMRPVGRLAFSEGLSAAARDHVRDQGRAGRTGHEGSDGSTPDRRAGRYGRWDVVLRESIAYGPRTARDVVTGLIIDDAVPDRGHRVNMFDPLLTVAGVACGPHAGFGAMCVIDYAGRFRDGAPPRAATPVTTDRGRSAGSARTSGVAPRKFVARAR